MCHYSLWFDENVCAPSFLFGTVLVSNFAKLCTQRTPAWCSAENQKLGIPAWYVCARVCVCVVVNGLDWTVKGWRNAACHMYAKAVKNIIYDFAVGRLFFFFSSIHSVAAAAGCVSFDLCYIWPPPPASPDKCSQSFRLAQTTPSSEYKFSMRPNKQRGHTTQIFYSISRDIRSMIYCMSAMRARYATRDAYAGLESGHIVYFIAWTKSLCLFCIHTHDIYFVYALRTRLLKWFTWI